MAFQPKNPAFEALHPRAKAGPTRGHFIDVVGLMEKLGGIWDEQHGVWNVPSGRRPDLERALAEVGMEGVDVPEGMRPLNAGDAGKKFAGGKIPPGWTDVFVSDDPAARLLVVGRDEKGRRQAIYSKAHMEAQAAEKFARVRALDERMPHVDGALHREALHDDTAAAVMLIRRMGLRPGSTKDTKAAKQAFGATTLQRRHVQVTGDTVRLKFTGKKGVAIDLTIEDPELAKVLKARRLPGRAGDDPIFDTNATKVNRWIAANVGDGFTAKDFRTRLGTAHAAEMVAHSPPPTTPKELRQLQLRVGDAVSSVLGNNRNQALESYIDPTVFPDVSPTGAPSGAPEVPGQAGREALRQAFENGHVDGAELGGGASNVSIRRVALADGTQAVLKEPKDAREHRAELVAGVVANALGAGVHTVGVEGDPEGQPVRALGQDLQRSVGPRLLTSFVDGQVGMDWIFEARTEPSMPEGGAELLPGGREIGVLDYLVNNADRHSGNWVVETAGYGPPHDVTLPSGEKVKARTPLSRVVPIDHGLSFPEADRSIVPRGGFAKHWLGLNQKPTPRPARDRETPNPKAPTASLHPRVSRTYLEELKQRLLAARSEFSDKEWDGIMGRLDELMLAAPSTIPDELPLPEVT